MIRLKGRRRFLWRNIHAPIPVMAGNLELGDAFGWTTAGLSAPVRALLRERLAGAADERDASDAAEFVARIAQQLQRIGDISPPLWGVGSRNPVKKTAIVFFACRDPFLAEACFPMAVQLADRIIQSPADGDAVEAELMGHIQRIRQRRLSVATHQMVEAVERHGIPWSRTAAGSNFVQLGQGVRQNRMTSSALTPESGLGRELAQHKLLTLGILAQLQLPVGQFAPVRDAASALKVAERLGYPVVLKPVLGDKGRAVFSGLRNAEDLQAVLKRVSLGREPFMLQTFLPGEDHRLLIIKGRLVAAAQRIPASVVGDGRHSVAELAAIENRNPRRIFGPLELLPLDAEADRILAQQGQTRDSVPEPGRRVQLRANANISTGGTSLDVTERVHPDNLRAAIRAAKALGLMVAGVDFICPDIGRSWREVGGGICEINTSIGMHPHTEANPNLDVPGLVLETVYPPGDEGRIPTAMITGTKGKTTTTLMLSRILEAAGHAVGNATTEGVTIDGELVLAGDHAEAHGASIVMQDPTVTAAVLETARGGLLQDGMYLDRCDVAALLNVGREQIGMHGVETLDEMAALKSKVLDAARKAVVLGADDPRTAAMARDCRVRLRTILFSLEPDSPEVRAHLGSGGEAIVIRAVEGRETIVHVDAQGAAVPLIGAEDFPASRGGLIRPNVANAMAAAGLALGLGVAPHHIREGLARYEITVASSRGRTNFVEGLPVRILFDRATDPASLTAMMPVIEAAAPQGRRICVLTAPGNRPDSHFGECAAVVAGRFDRYVCCEHDNFRRGKPPGEIADRLARGLAAAGVPEGLVSTARSPAEAARIVAKIAAADDFVAVFGWNVVETVEAYRTAFREAAATATG
ncbi:MAG TPA: Mur ligase family protein [Hypericibacter adhaerens]|uniref:Mur ligase family protein n=1 Tax=Hypericibacter adhaerens TaxID=2602016 RepID=UPI002BF03F6A|nr:Mur ligase family protein [Hypericibacter adhaerens]HWA43898.1 Mur ligase family protein [Hypericibacter adhaerens]